MPHGGEAAHNPTLLPTPITLRTDPCGGSHPKMLRAWATLTQP